MELIEGVVTRDGKATVRAGGESVQLTAPGADLKAARDAVLASAKDAVRERGEVCRLEISDNGRRHVFAAHPDGSLVPLADPSPADAAELHDVTTPAPVPVAPAPAAPETALIEDVPTGASLLTAAPAVPSSTPQLAVPPRPDLPSAPVEAPRADYPVEPAVATAPPADQGPVTRRSLRDTTFLVDDSRHDPAAKGFRGLLTRIGIKQEPSAAELAERDDIAVVSRHWPGTRTIAVVNRKGGSAKTPVVAGLSAVFGRYGGGGVLAWDNNENSGTLPIRTEQEPHGASVLDLLRDEDRLRDGQSHGLIAGYVHHQSADRYDVLWSDQNDFGDHEIQAEEVRRAHAVASRYYRMLVMDSGNTARAANWKAMIELTNQLVIATTTGEDRAELGSRTLQTIAERDEHGARLAENAVVVVSCWKPADMVEAQRIAGLFEPLVRSVVIVPFDNALKAGRIRFDAMQPNTQRAWLAAAAAVGRGL